MRFRISSFALTLSIGAPAFGATLQVGPGKTYAAPCDAIAAAVPGDIIEVDASGNYDGDVCGWNKNNLTIRGVGGRAKIDAAGQNAQGKAIWVIAGNDTVIENIELSGATVPDQNGAGIRQEGANLTVRNCFFHDNEDGILAGDNANSEILIEYSEFDNNGYGDGYSHNLYINHVKKLTFRFNWSHRASIGHLLKSRAGENHILYNRLTGENGTDSYEIDLPNGGKSYVIGNLIQQGPNTDNPTLLAYRLEGANAGNPSTELFVVNNTFVNDNGSGTFVNVQGAVTTAAILKNNVFFGGGTITNQASAVQANNYSAANPMLVNAAQFDYHLLTGSPCADAGADPGSGGGISLLPTAHYVHPIGSETRTSVGTIDIGAYELGGGSAGTGGSAGSGSGGSSGSANGGSANGGSSGSANGGSANGGSGGASTGGSANGGSANGGSGGKTAAGSGSEDDAGCGCRAPAHAPTGGLILLGALVGLALLRRRRE